MEIISAVALLLIGAYVRDRYDLVRASYGGGK